MKVDRCEIMKEEYKNIMGIRTKVAIQNAGKK